MLEVRNLPAQLQSVAGILFVVLQSYHQAVKSYQAFHLIWYTFLLVLLTFLLFNRLLLSRSYYVQDKAFKELAGAAPTNISAPAESLDGHTNPAAAKFCSEFHVPGQNIPLDFTLKSGMRVVSSSSVNWFHRLMNCGTLDGSISTKPLYSWVHPQCSLPNSVITALTSSMKEEGMLPKVYYYCFKSVIVLLKG